MMLMAKVGADHEEPVDFGRGRGELPVGFRQRVT